MKKILTFLFIVLVFSQTFLLSGCSVAVQGDLSTIYTVSREEGSGTRVAFTQIFGLASVDASGSAEDITTKESLIVNKTDVMLSAVEFGKSSIGYASFGSIGSGRVKAVSIGGVVPNIENVRSKAYPASRPFVLALNDSASELADDFVSFALSAEGQGIISESCVEAVGNPSPYSGSKPAGSIVVMGSSSAAPVVKKLAEGYKTVNPAAVIDVQSTDSGGGLLSLTEGTCDVAMLSRELNDSEKAQLRSFQIATDGIAVIVSKDNPVSNLSKEQVKYIFDGSVTNWGDII